MPHRGNCGARRERDARRVRGTVQVRGALSGVRHFGVSQENFMASSVPSNNDLYVPDPADQDDANGDGNVEVQTNPDLDPNKPVGSGTVPGGQDEQGRTYVDQKDPQSPSNMDEREKFDQPPKAANV